MTNAVSSLFYGLRAFQIYGANTNVGKTIISTLLCRAWLQHNRHESVWYLKPVSTGPADQADHSHVSAFARGVKAQCLYEFKDPVSPHIAAKQSEPLSDSAIIRKLEEQFTEFAESRPGVVFVETAGGVHSPTPSGTSQCDLYRQLRLPVILVGDHRLGGISATISAFESLHIRGYDTQSILIFNDSQYGNDEYLRDYFRDKDIPVVSLPLPPDPETSVHRDREFLGKYYKDISGSTHMAEVVGLLAAKHDARLQSLESMATSARNRIWYPFTQHQGLSSDDILPIDSAYGDFFQTYSKPEKQRDYNTQALSLLRPTFDGSGSWWTQGLGHSNPDLALTAAYAAGRYGHVMFAGTIHEPALSLANRLIEEGGNPRLTRVFYSDNGSTGVEVAVKMALGATCKRYNWTEDKREVGILGLKGSYHGDTVGAMDCSEPSVFNEQVAWYQGRGFWFDTPEVKLRRGVWSIEMPDAMVPEFDESVRFNSLGEIFDLKERQNSLLGEKYHQYIYDSLCKLSSEGRKFGALVLEPILLGAGGMIFVDPLFQQTMVSVVRENPSLFSRDAPTESRLGVENDGTNWSGLPVIFDEVFTGIYRLGRYTSASFLQVHPDISVHAKLLTGGLIPLCATLASEEIFNSFLGAGKNEALLHGHSYTAHAMGCTVAHRTLDIMTKMEAGTAWHDFKRMWAEAPIDNGFVASSEPRDAVVWSSWSKDFLTHLSYANRVDSVSALGSVLVLKLRDEGDMGYTSDAAVDLREQLSQGCAEFKIHCRVLGNVSYLVASQTSTRDTLGAIERLLMSLLLP